MNNRLTGLVVKMFINFIQTKHIWFYYESLGEEPKRVEAKDIINIADEFKKDYYV